jgi:hypothetical protein
MQRPKKFCCVNLLENVPLEEQERDEGIALLL